jgi:FkbM family methyltransferase
MDLIDRYYIKAPRLREAVTRALYRDRDEDVMLFRRRVRVNARRENGYLRASRQAQRLSLFRDEAAALQNLMLFARPRMSFVDVGANVGIFSVMMSGVARLYPEFDVTAFEAHPGTYARLAVNAGRHGFTAHNLAIGAEAGSARFVDGAVSHVATTAAHANAYNIPGRSFDAEMHRLDSFAFDKPLFLKVDVEGQELEVLQGASGLFDAGRIDAVFVDGCVDRRAARDFLAERGFLLMHGLTLRSPDEPVTLLALRPEAYPEVRNALPVAPAPTGTN